MRNGEEISAPRFHPFSARAEPLGVVVFVHPQGAGAPSELQHRFKGDGYLENVIGNPLETTIALSHLIFAGTLDRFDTGCLARPDRCSGGTYGPIKKKPSEYLKQMTSTPWSSPAKASATSPPRWARAG